MTPNPNPSPELLKDYAVRGLQIAAQDIKIERMSTALKQIANLPWASGRETPADACGEMQALANAALSPQTLPAPGEVERVLVPREPTQEQLIAGNEMFHAGEVPLNIYRAMIAAAPSRSITSQGERVQEAFSGVMRAEVVDAGAWSLHLHFGRGDGARDRMRAASSLLASIVTASTPLATVAAANDEGDWVLVPREITQAMLDATCATDADDQAMRVAWSELLRTAASPSNASSQTHGKWHVMLLNLVNAVHRDRGVKTQAIGIQASYEQALAAIRLLSQGGGK